MQVGRVVAAVAVVGAVVSGCGGASQAGTAVFVGEDAVPLERVQSRLDTALARTDEVAQLNAQGGTTADLARSFVTREVLHGLLERRAAAEGVVVTEPQVDAQLTQLQGDGLGVDSFLEGPALREWARDRLIAAELARRAVPGLAVTVDLVGATSREDAQAKAAALAAGGPGADALFTDPRMSRRDATVQAASAPADAASVLFGVPVGAVVAFQPSPQQATWIVFQVTDRRTDAAAADPAALGMLSQSQLAAIGERMLQPTADQVGIRVNPRYGVWDPIQFRVVGEDQQAGLILPPTAS